MNSTWTRLPQDWVTQMVRVNPVTGCWLWRSAFLSPQAARRLIRNGLPSPDDPVDVGSCDIDDACVHPLHRSAS